MYYCYICNKLMRHTVYVCNAHEDDPQTRKAFHYVLSDVSGVFALGPRDTPSAPFVDLFRFGIGVDPDLLMNEGL